MINCNKCRGAVFVDRTFSDNKDYELSCIRCGKRWFIHARHPMRNLIAAAERRFSEAL